MLSFEMVLKHDRLMKSLTGLSREEFEVLLPTFEQVWKESLESKERQRAVGGGLKVFGPASS
ncbi:hypothetical protein FACS1894122_13640 [Alphaproteobacteria bacterium]|nr:hypothetical protein FACS1894122_13640 [Alphaproteobacteria bacterium]